MLRTSRESRSSTTANRVPVGRPRAMLHDPIIGKITELGVSQATRLPKLMAVWASPLKLCFPTKSQTGSVRGAGRVCLIYVLVLRGVNSVCIYLVFRPWEKPHPWI